MKKRLFLFTALTSLFLASCAGVPSPLATTPVEEEDEFDLVNQAIDRTEINVERGENAAPLKIDKDDPYTELTKSVYDFGPLKQSNDDLHFTVVDKNMKADILYAAHSDIFIDEESVALYDNRGRNYPFKSFIEGYGEAQLSFATSIFNPRNVYYLELKNDNLMFLGKDEDIRRLTFYTLNRGLPDGKQVDYRDDIVDVDSTKVYYYDEDGYSPFFVYEDDLSLATDTTFRLRNPLLLEDDIETVYGKVLSIQKNPNGAGTMVRYKPAKGADIYSNLSINDNKHLNEDDNVTYYDTEEQQNLGIANAILHNPSMVTTVYGLMNAFHASPKDLARGTMDWGSRIDVKVNTSYDPSQNAFTLSISGAFTFYPDNNITVTLKLGWTKTWSFDVSASVSIETEFFVPVGIDYTLKVVEDTQQEIYFGICVSYDHMGEYDEKKTEDEINQAVMDAFNDRSDWQKRSVFKGDGGCATQGGATYPLFKISCTYFLPIEIYFDVEFYWELVPTVEVIIRYSSHTQRVDLCVSNEGGADPSSDSATKTSSDLSFTFIGKVHMEIGLRVSIGIDIIGLYKFFHVEVYLEIYGAVDIQGYLFADISWSDDEPVVPDLSLGCKFEVSVGLKVGVDIYLLFGGYNHEWPVVAVVLFGMEMSSPFQEFVQESEDIYINEDDFDADKKQFALSLGERHLLAARTFNADSFLVEIKDMNYNDKAKAIYGAFVPEDVMLDIFTLKSIDVKEGELVSDIKLTEDGHIAMDTVLGQDNFVAEIQIQANKKVSCGKEPIKTITVHFENTDRQDISIDGKTLGSFVNGAEVKLPVPDPRRYLKFTGYTYVDKMGETQTISYDETKPESFVYTVNTDGDFRDCELKSVWIDYFHWEVFFVDGFNNLIEKQMVLDGEDAVEPDADKRDHNMKDNPPDDSHHYEFVGYDRELTNIQGPTVIRAIYKIVNN